MESVINFLINNYIVFVIIAVVLIFGLIGFFVDTSKNQVTNNDEDKTDDNSISKEKNVIKLSDEVVKQADSNQNDNQIQQPLKEQPKQKKEKVKPVKKERKPKREKKKKNHKQEETQVDETPTIGELMQQEQQQNQQINNATPLNIMSNVDLPQLNPDANQQNKNNNINNGV